LKEREEMLAFVLRPRRSSNNREPSALLNTRKTVPWPGEREREREREKKREKERERERERERKRERESMRGHVQHFYSYPTGQKLQLNTADRVKQTREGKASTTRASRRHLLGCGRKHGAGVVERQRGDG
jgi:hypothetical protein